MKKIIILCACILLSGCSPNQKYNELNQQIEQLRIENETLLMQLDKAESKIEQLENTLEDSRDLIEENELLSDLLELSNSQLVNTALLRSKSEVSLDKDLPGIYVSEDDKCYIIFDNGWFISFYKKDNLQSVFEGTWYIKDSLLIWGNNTASEYTYKIENNVLYLDNEWQHLKWSKLGLK